MSVVVAALLLAATLPSAGHVRQLLAGDSWREAIDEARRLVAATPDDPDAAGALGEALYRAGRIEEAGEILEPIVAGDGAPGRALAQLGLVRAAQGRDDEAGVLLERALSASPDDRFVVYHASSGARTRARAVELLAAYLARSAGDDPDRIEGARGTIRLYTALGERKVWVPVARPDRVDVPLQPLVGGARPGWVVEAELANRKKLRLLLDTGSSGLFVVHRAVKKGGYAPLSDETVFAGGGEGRTRSARGILRHLAIGPLVFQDALVTTTTDEFDSQGRIHGVLGVSAFSGYAITLDLARGRLLLGPPPAQPGGDPYWSVGGQLLVRAAADGAAAPGLFLLDTGASRSMLSRAYVETIPGAVTAAPTTVNTYGGKIADASMVRGVTLRFSGVASRGDPVNQSNLTQRSRLGGVEVSGFLGLDLLDGTSITIDTTRQRAAVSRVP